MNKTFKKEKVVNALWAIISKFLSGIKLVIVGVVVARYLGPEEFGAYNYAVSFVLLLSVLAEFRLHNILIREISKNETNTEVILGSAFFSCTFFSIIGYLTLFILVRIIEENEELRLFILIYGLTYFFQTLRFLRAFFIARYENVIIFKIEIIVSILVVMSSVLVSIYETSVLSFLLIRVFDIVLISSLLVIFYQIKFKNNGRWKLNIKISKQLIKSSSPLVISSLALVIFQQFDKIMIKHILNEYSVGQYSAAVSIISLIVFVPVVLTETITPSLVRLKLEEKQKNYALRLQLFSDYIIWSSVFLCVFVTLLSPFIIDVVYGTEYVESISILKIFTWQSVFIAMGSVAAQIMIIDNKHQIAYLKSISAGIINVMLNLLWIPKYGIMGAVWASIIAYLISSYIAHFFIKRYRYIFFIQTRSLIFGLGNIINDLKTLKGRKND